MNKKKTLSLSSVCGFLSTAGHLEKNPTMISLVTSFYDNSLITSDKFVNPLQQHNALLGCPSVHSLSVFDGDSLTNIWL